jgi:hypothetical protein
MAAGLTLPPGDLGLQANDQVPTYFFDFLMVSADGGHGETEVFVMVLECTLCCPPSFGFTWKLSLVVGGFS